MVCAIFFWRCIHTPCLRTFRNQNKPNVNVYSFNFSKFLVFLFGCHHLSIVCISLVGHHQNSWLVGCVFKKRTIAIDWIPWPLYTFHSVYPTIAVNSSTLTPTTPTASSHINDPNVDFLKAQHTYTPNIVDCLLNTGSLAFVQLIA